MHPKLNSLLEHCTPGPMALSAEWHALRKFDPQRNPPVVLGASLAGAVCGLSPYTMALEVFMRQRDLLPPIEVTAAMEDGLDFEPVVLKKFAKRRNVEILTGLPMYLSRTWPWMAATPDAIALFDPIEGVDAKVTTFRRYDSFGIDQNAYGEDESDQLPTDNVMQAQQQMAVMGLKAVQFPVMFDIRTIRLYRVEREQALIDMIVAAGEEMVERIKNNDPPEPDFKHPSAVKIIRELHGLVTGKTIELDEATVAGWNRLSHLKEQIKDLTKEADEIKAIVLHKLADAEAGLFPRGTKQIKRSVVRPSYWTDSDLKEIEAKIGQVKRNGHERLLESKVKGA
jgi:predicted phage-related endonuclease